MLIYQIAEEFIILHTDSPEVVRQTFGKYAPFEREHLPNDRQPILEVWGGTTIEITPEDSLVEEVDDYAFYSRVYRRSSGEICIEMNAYGQTIRGLVSPDWHHLQLSMPLDYRPGFALIDRLIMVAYSVATSQLGCIKVHASVIELGGRAIVLMGVSGTGKSTHSRLWLEHVPGATLLNDDEPIIRQMPDGVVRVYGCPWSGSTPCYRDAWAEVAAFVHLYQAPYNELTKLPTREAFASLYGSCAFMHASPEVQLAVFDSVADILGQIAVYRLDNRPELDAVKLTHALL